MELTKESKSFSDEKENEEFVESWLNENQSWFEMYALENLDLNTIEKWLLIHHKKICKCNLTNDSKSLNKFPRRKSCIPSTISEESNETKIVKETRTKNPIHENENIKLIRSSSYDSLFFEKMEINNDSEKKNLNFYLEEDSIEKEDYMTMKILERSVFSKPDSASNSQLLKLLKSKIKLPNIGKKLSFEEKVDLRKKMSGNMFEFLVIIIQETAKEVLPKEASNSIKNNLKALINCEYSSVLLLEKTHNKLYSYSYDHLFSKCNETKDRLSNDWVTQIDAYSGLFENIIRRGITIVLNPEKVKILILLTNLISNK